MHNPLLSANDPAFLIRVDPAERFVEIHLKGFWSVTDLHRFATTLRRLLVELVAGGCAIGEQTTLFDLTGFDVQSQEVQIGLAGMASDPTIASRRIAVILSSALLRMQARRAAPAYGFFETRPEAMAWLTAA